MFLRSIIVFGFAVFLLGLLHNVSIGKEIPLFPDAEGFGKETPAGRYGKILRVTNLNDTGPGSFRSAVQAEGRRTVVFEVSGRIDLKSDLILRNPYCTIAGQTAPSPGIMVTGKTFSVQAHDVLVQHLFFRLGDERQKSGGGRSADAIQIVGRNAARVFFDHVSASWAIDELVGVGYGIQDVTFRRCLFAEPLNRSMHPKGEHGYGILLGDNSVRVSLVENILAHAKARMPRIQGGAFVLLRNIFYNAGTSEFAAIGSNKGIPTILAAVGNVFIRGPSGRPATAIAEMKKNIATGSRIYLSRNIYADGVLFRGKHKVHSIPPEVRLEGLEDKNKPGDDLLRYLIARAGARPAERNSVDRRIIDDLLNSTGRLIDSQQDVGGFPEMTSQRRPFDPGNSPHGDDDGDGYTNLEEILHRMSEHVEKGSKNSNFDKGV